MKRCLIILIIVVFLITGCSTKNTDTNHFESYFDDANFLELSYSDLVTYYENSCDITIDDLNLSDAEKDVIQTYKGKKLIFATTNSKLSYGSDGGVSFGANILYINLLSKLFDFEAEFIPYPSFIEAKFSVLNGDCDFLLDVFMSEGLEKIYDYSSPISNQTYILFGYSFDYLKKDFLILNDSIIGYKDGKSFKDIKNKLNRMDIDVTLKPYDSFENIAIALKNGEIQYAIGNESCSTRYYDLGLNSYSLSHMLNCPPTYAVSKKDTHTEFLSIMSKAIDLQLFDLIASYKKQLSKKIKFDNIDFTNKELELINSQKPCKMFLPIMQDDFETSGTISLYNFMFAILNEASNLVGIEAKPVYNCDIDKKSTNVLDDDTITTTICYSGSNQNRVVCSDSFIESKTIIVGLDDKEAVNSFSYFDGKSIGVIKNSHISNILKDNLPTSFIKDDYYCMSQTIDALENGEVDFIPLTELAYISLKEQEKRHSYINVFETDIYQHTTFAFNDTQEGRLYASIYSKLLTIIDVDYLKSQSLDYYSTIKTIQDKNNQRFLFMFLITIGLLLIIFLLVSLAIIDHNRKNLAKQASVDFLTGLNNRYAFDLDCKTPLNYDDTVLFIDLNKFKQINDLYGHHFGDLVLTKFAKSLGVFNTKQIYRMSGDEFFIITNNFDIENINNYIESIEISVFDDSTKNNVKISVSIGIIAPGVISSKEHAVIISDYAMYENKDSDKTKYTYVDKSKYKEIEESYKLESKFLDDVNANKLYCEYQPIVDVNTNKIISIEALTRWNNDGKIISPFVFLSIADKLNMIHNVDLNCFNQIKKLYRYLNDNGLDDNKLIFSINLTQESLLTISDVLIDDDEIPKSRVQLEVIESVTLNKATFDAIIRLHSVGFIIAIDDYGSGQSSIPIIESDVFNTIKLDKSLLEIKDLKQSLIPNLYEMFSDIGKKIIIEGIETQKHINFIKAVGIKYVQGYYYYKPMPKQDIIELLKKQK